MQRPLKFKVWDKNKNNWLDLTNITYYPFYILHGALLILGSLDEKEDYIFQQFTGLLDKNGKEIYEGDILSFDGNMTADNSIGCDPNGYIYDEYSIHEVIWDKDNCCWNLRFSDDENLKENWKYRRDTRLLMTEHSKDIEIIGNIYENPELMESYEKKI